MHQKFGQVTIDSCHRFGSHSILLCTENLYLAQVTHTLNSLKVERVQRKKETKDVGDGGKESAKSAEKFVDDRESFKVSFDVSKFKPEEITIRSEDGELLVEGKQEAKNEEGYSTRHFVRSYSLPRNIDRDSFQSRLSKEGILSIEAKKLQKPEAKDNFIKIETED